MRATAVKSTRRVWGVRVVALGALVLTVWLAGPRAWRSIEGRLAWASADENAVRVELDRVGFRSLPSWLDGDLLVAVLEDLSPHLRGELGLLDDAGALAVETALAQSPWVNKVDLQRQFPDRVVADLELRRPVLEVWVGTAGLLVLLDETGRCLPPVPGLGLPRTVLGHGRRHPVEEIVARPYPDARVVAAARVAAEWRDEVAPKLTSAPELVEVDAQNLGYPFLSQGRWSEVRVGIRREDGQVVFFDYGHPPGSDSERVPVAIKVVVLKQVLREHPGLSGIDGGDLRFANRWRDWLLPRGPVAQSR